MHANSTALYDAVRASRLAEGLSPEQTAVLAQLLRLQTLPAREVLAREGSADNLLYVVVTGALGAVKNLGAADEATIVTLKAGDFAHELGFLDGAARYASLVTLVPTQVLVLEREKLESLVVTDPRILYRVMCSIVRAVHTVQTRLSVQASELTNYIFKQHGRY
jgi:CRP/FNR family cyclic AMP-dependent transcriptional regulator